MTTKPFWVFNTAGAIAAALPLLGGHEAAPAPEALLGADQALDTAGAALGPIEAALPLLRGVLPAEYYAWVAGVVIVGNVLLRVVTQTRLAMKRDQELK